MRNLKRGGSNQLTILSERNYCKNHHVSYDTVLGMENAFSKEGAVVTCLSPYWYTFNRILNRIFRKRVHDISIKCYKEQWYLFIAMGKGNLERQMHTLKRISQKTNHLILYCFDTWEAQYNEWNELFQKINPAHIFLAYKSSTEYFSQIRENIHFLPQSMDETFFHSREIKKQRLFMQMGRKNTNIHNMILSYLKKQNLDNMNENYVYEKEKGKIIYPDTNELAENICKTKYFVCAPQSLENKQLTGNISDVTARFYEAMACKSLIIGFKPNTYDLLFPKDSMVELKDDGSNFEEVITYFEKNPDEYQNIVDKNYSYVMENHRWANRYQIILENLNYCKENVN